MPKTSEITVPCGNRYCDNPAASIDAICGNLISSPDEKCDYLNYASPKSVASLGLTFLLPSVSDEMLKQLQEDEERYINLNGCRVRPPIEG